MNNLFDKQTAFLMDLWGRFPGDPDARVRESKDLSLHLLSEVTEFLQCLPFKSHRLHQSEVVLKGGLTEELVDIFKYLLDLAIVWDITPEEFLTTFEAKSLVVEHRLQQERVLDAATKDGKSIAVLDLDGVLLDSHNAWLDHLYEVTGAWFQTRRQARASLGSVRYEELKHAYRLSGKKARIPQAEFALPLTLILKQLGYFIAVVTARPYGRYPNLWGETLESLKGLCFDFVAFDTKKRERIRTFAKNVTLVIEDDVEQALEMTNPWTRVFLLENEENRYITKSSLFEIPGVTKIDLLSRVFDALR